MTVRGRSLIAVVVAFLFLAGQTCVLPMPSAASITAEDRDHTQPAAQAPAPSSADGDHHDPSVSAHCADSAVGSASAARAPVVSTILVPCSLAVLAPRTAVRTLELFADVGDPPRFLLHVSLLI